MKYLVSSAENWTFTTLLERCNKAGAAPAAVSTGSHTPSPYSPIPCALRTALCGAPSGTQPQLGLSKSFCTYFQGQVTRRTEEVRNRLGPRSAGGGIRGKVSRMMGR